MNRLKHGHLRQKENISDSVHIKPTFRDIYYPKMRSPIPSPDRMKDCSSSPYKLDPDNVTEVDQNVNEVESFENYVHRIPLPTKSISFSSQLARPDSSKGVVLGKDGERRPLSSSKDKSSLHLFPEELKFKLDKGVLEEEVETIQKELAREERRRKRKISKFPDNTSENVSAIASFEGVTLQSSVNSVQKFDEESFIQASLSSSHFSAKISAVADAMRRKRINPNHVYEIEQLLSSMKILGAEESNMASALSTLLGLPKTPAPRKAMPTPKLRKRIMKTEPSNSLGNSKHILSKASGQPLTIAAKKLKIIQGATNYPAVTTIKLPLKSDRATEPGTGDNRLDRDHSEASVQIISEIAGAPYNINDTSPQFFSVGDPESSVFDASGTEFEQISGTISRVNSANFPDTLNAPSIVIPNAYEPDPSRITVESLVHPLSPTNQSQPGVNRLNTSPISRAYKVSPSKKANKIAVTSVIGRIREKGPIEEVSHEDTNSVAQTLNTARTTDSPFHIKTNENMSHLNDLISIKPSGRIPSIPRSNSPEQIKSRPPSRALLSAGGVRVLSTSECDTGEKGKLSLKSRSQHSIPNNLTLDDYFRSKRKIQEELDDNQKNVEDGTEPFRPFSGQLTFPSEEHSGIDPFEHLSDEHFRSRSFDSTQNPAFIDLPAEVTAVFADRKVGNQHATTENISTSKKSPPYNIIEQNMQKVDMNFIAKQDDPNEDENFFAAFNDSDDRCSDNSSVKPDNATQQDFFTAEEVDMEEELQRELKQLFRKDGNVRNIGKSSTQASKEQVFGSNYKRMTKPKAASTGRDKRIKQGLPSKLKILPPLQGSLSTTSLPNPFVSNTLNTSESAPSLENGLTATKLATKTNKLNIVPRGSTSSMLKPSPNMVMLAELFGDELPRFNPQKIKLSNISVDQSSSAKLSSTDSQSGSSLFSALNSLTSRQQREAITTEAGSSTKFSYKSSSYSTDTDGSARRRSIGMEVLKPVTPIVEIVERRSIHSPSQNSSVSSLNSYYGDSTKNVSVSARKVKR